MNIGITSIQRNRNPWILEWLAFHMLVGFNSFYIYSHKCSDGMTETLLKLAQHYKIAVHELDMDDSPQLMCYEHSVNNYLPLVDWMAFIDGDEFLFPTSKGSMSEALNFFDEYKLSALAVYWKCYGSNGHLLDPGGLLVENFPRHSSDGYIINRHVKSIIKGVNQSKVSVHGSHLFKTEFGTYDEKLRLIDKGWMTELEPSYNHFRINHYIIQSYDFFKNVKQKMGQADLKNKYELPEEAFFAHDRNECDDGAMYNYLIRLKLKLIELKGVL